MVRSHWGKHYRSLKRGANNVSNTARQIRDFIGGLDSRVGNLSLPDTLSMEQGGSVRSAKQSHKDDLVKARDLLQIERDRAINKIHRMATSPDGADIRGTKYDPIGKSSIGRVTLKNAKVELERLSEFNNSNSVWYHSDSKGNPISDKDVRRYRDAVRRYNEHIDNYERSIAGTNIPFLGDATVGDWIRDFRPKKTYLPGGSSYALERMNPDKRTTSFASAESMNQDVAIMAYSAKYASTFYGTFHISFKACSRALALGTPSRIGTVAMLSTTRRCGNSPPSCKT